MKKRGGMFIPSQEKSKLLNTLQKYLTNSKITKMGKGSYGITYVAKLNNAAVISDPFLNLNVGESYKTPVTNLLIKLCIIDGNPDNDDDTFRDDSTWDVYKKMKIIPVPETEFINEINIQTDVYLKTMQYLQPLCPGIVYADILTRNENKSNILNFFPEIPQKFSTFRQKDEEMKVGFGIVVMELASNYLRFFDFIHYADDDDDDDDEPDIDVEDIEQKCRFALIKLALDTGYSHGDHHPGNIMYNNDDTSYFDGRPGRPLLIDFGRSTKIPPTQMNEFKNLCQNKQYFQALDLLCQNPTANSYIADPTHAEQFYGWACGTYGDKVKSPYTDAEIKDMNEEMAQLFMYREEQIDKNVKIMEKLHAENNKYPLLPLSNRAKNQLYNGILFASQNNKIIPVVNPVNNNDTIIPTKPSDTTFKMINFSDMNDPNNPFFQKQNLNNTLPPKIGGRRRSYKTKRNNKKQKKYTIKKQKKTLKRKKLI